MWSSSLILLCWSLLRGPLVALEAPARPPVEVLDRHGERVGFLGHRTREHQRSLAEIPADLRALVLLAEDRRFFSHPGVDFPRLVRVLGQGLASGVLSAGASTLTQQWVRQRLNVPRRGVYKPLVVLLALLHEARHSKEEILERYLNELRFAGNTQGVAAAAEYYFGRPLEDLILSEHAMLAVLIRSPEGLARPAQEDRLHALTKKLLREYRPSFELVSLPTLQRHRRASTAFGYVNFLGQHFRHHAGTLRTTLDLYLQRELDLMAREEIHRLRDKGVRHAALVVLDAMNGDVLSYVSSADYFSPDAGQVDGLQEARQPGSLIKAFTYGLAFDENYHPASIVPDVPTVFRSGAGLYRPRNYDERFTGPRRAREALANSLNLPALVLADELGPDKLHRALGDLGVVLPEEASYYGVGLTLGNAEISPLALAQSFTAFSRQDSWVRARWLRSAPVQAHASPISPQASYLVTDILRDGAARIGAFGARTVFDFPFDVAAKTGTSTDYRDNWAVAWTREHVVLVWVGNHDQKPMQRVSGISGAGPLLKSALHALYAKRTPLPFVPPVPYRVHPVCALSGELAGEHCPRVVEEKFFNSRPEEKCAWHQREHSPECGTRVITHYPEQFQEWARQQPSDACVPEEGSRVLRSTLAAQLTYPVDGAVFAIDPDVPRDHQRLPLKFIGPSEGVRWEVDGKVISVAPTDADWPLEPGSHVIRLYQYGELQDEARILVR